MLEASKALVIDEMAFLIITQACIEQYLSSNIIPKKPEKSVHYFGLIQPSQRSCVTEFGYCSWVCGERPAPRKGSNNQRRKGNHKGRQAND
jgi:hypothetical protein